MMAELVDRARMTYTINLQKLVIPGRAWTTAQPFPILVDGCNSNDQIFLDPTLGVNVDVTWWTRT